MSQKEIGLGLIPQEGDANQTRESAMQPGPRTTYMPNYGIEVRTGRRKTMEQNWSEMKV